MNSRNVRLAGAVLGVIAMPFALKAEWPDAPSLHAPPILSEAKMWLDAWDYGSFTTNDAGGVVTWADKSGHGNDATNYQGAAFGTVGLTNGVPAYLMGDTGTGIDLRFPCMTDIRSVFWVMDIKGGAEGVGADFLAYSAKGDNNHDFMRHDACVFAWTAAAFLGNLWFDDRWLFTWKEKRFCIRDIHLPVGTAVYSLSCTNNLTADSLSHPLNSATHSGGRALSELIVFNRTLSVDEVNMVKSYLRVKWVCSSAAKITGEVTFEEVTGYEDLTLGANASFVLTDAVLGSPLAAPVNVWGAFDKTEAGKIRLSYAGHVWHRSQALFHVGAGGLTLDDFELTGFPSDATFACDGKTLTMSIGGDVAVPSVLASGATGPRLWLDASADDAFVTNATGGVLRWNDRSGNGNDATNYPYGQEWNYPTVGLTNGVPALLLGGHGSKLDLAFPKMDDIRTVFWAIDIENSERASFLGSFVPGDAAWENQAYQRSGNNRGA